MLKTVNIDEFRKSKDFKVQHRSQSTLLISKNKVVKILDESTLSYFENTGHPLEDRLKESYRLNGIKGHNPPTEMVEDLGRIVGFAAPHIEGDLYGELMKKDLSLPQCAYLQKQIDRILMESHDRGIVFPDLCNAGNIIVKPNGRVVFLDYDGFQFDDMVVRNYASYIAPLKHLEEIGGYDSKTNLFTAKADAVSAALLCFKMAFGLSKALLNPNSIDWVLKETNIRNKKMQRKVKRIFSPGTTEEYLGDHLSGLTNDFTLKKIPSMPYRRLEKK